jgi:hypothetical protein
MQRSKRLKFTFLVVAAVVLPIAVSMAAASYCALFFEIGGTAFKAIKGISFFTVLAAEAFVYVKCRRWWLFRKEP